MPSFSPERSLIRVGVVAVVLVTAAALFARSQARRTREHLTAGAPAAASYPAPLRDAVERLMEGHATAPAPSAAATTVCATSLVGADRPTGVRRRAYVQVACRAACREGDVVAVASGVEFPAAVALVRDAGGWHPVGFEAPTDADYARDMNAIFPPALRQKMDEQPRDPALEARLAERMAERFAGAAWRGDGAPAGCGTR